jgi:hypothetical protein
VEESTHAALRAVEREAKRRIDELIGTAAHLLEFSDERVPQIRADLPPTRRCFKINSAGTRMIERNAGSRGRRMGANRSVVKPRIRDLWLRRSSLLSRRDTQRHN